jgi:hypothetical protein
MVAVTWLTSWEGLAYGPLVTSDERLAIEEQVNTEWRLHRRAEQGRGPLQTEAEIATAEAAWKQARFQQLAATRSVPLEALES